VAPKPANARAAAVAWRVNGTVPLVRVDQGQSNDVWFAGDIVIRMSRRPGGTSLLSEARVVTALPSAVGHPPVLASGIEDAHDWMATARLPGRNLGECWQDLAQPDQERAITDLFQRVMAVHAADLSALPALDPSPFYALDPQRAHRDLQALAEVLDQKALSWLHEFLDAGFDAMTGIPRVLVYTDAGAHNAVWDGHRAIPVDFEFATHRTWRPRSGVSRPQDHHRQSAPAACVPSALRRPTSIGRR
jgi:hypothetical protein